MFFIYLFYQYFLKKYFFEILFIKIQVIFINFPIQYVLAKKSSKIYFLKHSQQHINLSERLMFGLPQDTIVVVVVVVVVVAVVVVVVV